MLRAERTVQLIFISTQGELLRMLGIEMYWKSAVLSVRTCLGLVVTYKLIISVNAIEK